MMLQDISFFVSGIATCTAVTLRHSLVYQMAPLSCALNVRFGPFLIVFLLC